MIIGDTYERTKKKNFISEIIITEKAYELYFTCINPNLIFIFKCQTGSGLINHNKINREKKSKTD